MTDNNEKGDENAKNPKWKVPMDLPGVIPEDYDAAIPSGRGSAGKRPQGQVKSHKKPVDVATLEKSNATSGNDSKNPGPVAVGEASS